MLGVYFANTGIDFLIENKTSLAWYTSSDTHQASTLLFSFLIASDAYLQRYVESFTEPHAVICFHMIFAGRHRRHMYLRLAAARAAASCSGLLAAVRGRWAAAAGVVATAGYWHLALASRVEAGDVSLAGHASARHKGRARNLSNIYYVLLR